MEATDYPYADSSAAKMLSTAIQRAKEERGLSLRQLGKLLEYKQAVVLSHMATGRVPIPIDRAEDFADIFEIEKKTFLAAVLLQRHPDVNWSLLGQVNLDTASQSSAFAEDLEIIVGHSLADLSIQHRRVMREVAADTRPGRRWLTVHEVPVIEMIRALRPSVSEIGLAQDDKIALQALLES